MRRIIFALIAVIAAGIVAYMAHASGHADGEAVPIFGINIPPGHRDWKLISMAHEAGDLNDIRAILGNDRAVRAYRKEKLPFPTHLLLPLQLARHAAPKMRPGGTLLFMSGTGGRRTAVGFVLVSAMTAALPAMARNLALELAPVRVNVIAAGFVDTPLLENRRNQLRATLPIRRVVGPADVAALAIHIMTNTALTGATYDIDGEQQVLAG